MELMEEFIEGEDRMVRIEPHLQISSLVFYPLNYMQNRK